LTDLGHRPLDPGQIERLRLLDHDPGILLFTGWTALAALTLGIVGGWGSSCSHGRIRGAWM